MVNNRVIDFHTHTFPEAIAARAVAQLSAASHTKAFTDGTEAGLCASNGEARRAIQQGGVSIGDRKVTDLFESVKKDAFTAGDFILRRGKKNFRKLEIQ